MSNPQTPSRRVGVIGLGAMGAGIAQSLRRAGHDVHVYDIRKEACAAFAVQGGVACATLADWKRAGVDDVMMSVNVSAVQLLRSDLSRTVQRVLRETGVQAGQLELELTESVLMANAEHATERLQTFRGLGVSIAVDDFGTGYSSLAYLRRLPITTLKIDKAFIDDLGSPGDNEDAAITTTVIGMRCDTPDRRSMRLSVRASKAMRSTVSAMKSGTRTGSAPRFVHASCAVIDIPSSTVSG